MLPMARHWDLQDSQGRHVEVQRKNYEPYIALE